MPRTLSRDHAEAAAARCKEILARYEIMDVEIAFRESVFTRFTGPRLFNHVPLVHPTADVQGQFTPALGLQIARKSFSYIEGTGCLYLRESGDSDRVFLLTARHVALPPSKHANNLYHRKNNSVPRLDVIHLGSKAYQTALEAITDKVDHETIMIAYYKKEIDKLEPDADDESGKKTATREAFQCELAKAVRSKADANELYDEISRFWTIESKRVLGYVLYSPPISVNIGDKGFTEDWALVELDRDKFDWNAFRGNVIHLGTFRFISLRSYSLTIMSRNQTYVGRIHEEDVPLPRESRPVPISGWWLHAAS
jgi:hypothetical protein